MGIDDPQTEIAVELYGTGEPIDVTQRHTLASAAPFTVALQDSPVIERANDRLALHFRERTGRQRVLGKLGLRLADVIPLGDRGIACFTVRSPQNYCLSAPRLWARYLHLAYQRWRRPPDIPVSAGDVHAMTIFFICPRPVALVSVADGFGGNLFPMNLMGPLGGELFGFALNRARAAATIVSRVRRMAISSVPMEHAALARRLGRNHRRERIEWNELGFPLARSHEFALPVPAFALRVREAEVLEAREIGSHRFFLARVIRDECWSRGSQFCTVHGIYAGLKARAG